MKTEIIRIIPHFNQTKLGGVTSPLLMILVTSFGCHCKAQ